MALQGIVSPVADVQSGIIPGDEWLALIGSLSPTPLLIRAGIGADSANHVHIEAIKSGLTAYTQAGHKVYLVLELGLWGGPEDPNGVLGYQGDQFRNAFIEKWSLTACSVLNQLVGLVDIVILANEPNLAADTLKPGDKRPKPSALAAEVYASLLYTAATRIRDLCPHIKTIYPAGFSILVKFATSIDDGWFGHYYDKMIAHLTAHGAHAPWPWEGMLINTEGAVTPSYANYLAYGMAHHKSALGITGPSIIGEWSVPSTRIDVEKMTACFHALDSVFAAMFFFQLPLYTPGDVTGYGAVDWTVAGNRFVPGAPTPWIALLKDLYAQQKG